MNNQAKFVDLSIYFIHWVTLYDFNQYTFVQMYGNLCVNCFHTELIVILSMLNFPILGETFIGDESAVFPVCRMKIVPRIFNGINLLP